MKNIYITVVSVYVPTAKAPPAIVHKLMDDPQDTVDGVSAFNVLMFLEDLNA